MINALTYEEMLKKIKDNSLDKGIYDDYVAILLTRPDLETGQNILNSLVYYHHMTGEYINFYLPGYSAFGGEKYITDVGDIPWYFCTKEFVRFYEKLERITSWIYSGESELILLELKKGQLQYSHTIVFYIDAMLRDHVIDSIPLFMQNLARTCKNKDTINGISNCFGNKKAKELAIDIFFQDNPLGKIFEQEKYFCIRNIEKSGI